jgi:hypothetical protein
MHSLFFAALGMGGIRRTCSRVDARSAGDAVAVITSLENEI